MTIKNFKSRPISKLLAAVVFCSVVCGLLARVTNIFENKAEDAMTKEYIEYDHDTFDVIFLGSSVMLNDIYPLQLYDECGIASYNLGCGSQSVASSYYLAKMVIEEQHPDLIIFDCNMCQEGLVYSSQEKFHYVTDALTTLQKAEMVFNLVPQESWVDFFYEMSIYHERWKELSSDDFQHVGNGTYGAKVHFASRPLPEYTITTETTPLPELSEEYLRKIIELCKENDVELLLTIMPMNFSAQYDIYDRNVWQKYYNTIQIIAEEEDINYLNFMYHVDEVGLDAEKDYDGDSHLNGWGAPKMTAYIGNYIKQNYDIRDVRGDSSYDFMAEDYILFMEYKDSLERMQ